MTSKIKYAKIEGENLYVRTDYDDKYDMVQIFTGIYVGTELETNKPFDYGNAGLVPKDSDSLTDFDRILVHGVDESAPFKINNVYIGANHGMPRAVIVKSPSHGKTYGDIGSCWKDSEGVKWDILKVLDKDNLVMMSENLSGDSNKFLMKTEFIGNLTCADEKYAEHREDIIVESLTINQQLYPSIRKLEFSVKVVTDGEKKDMAEKEFFECDYIEINEKYQIMNPALIGDALRANRPEGGYDEPQNLAIGEPLIDYNMTYLITSDGNVTSAFEHTIHENVDFDFYSGIQFQLRNDAYGGGVYRYIPKIKSFTKIYNDEELTYDFTESYNVSKAVKEGNYIGFSDQHAVVDLWEDSKNPPDRMIDYIHDENGKIRAGFAAGYLLIADGEPSVRAKKTDSVAYFYRSGKGYPIFINSAAFEESGTKNQKIQGVAYKTHKVKIDGKVSYYTVAYGGDIFVYIDFHEVCTKDFVIDDLGISDAHISEVEKSANILYEINNGKISATMKDGAYGYIVLCGNKL